jgi:uncharacterized protein YecE (DUF72 family)
MSQAELAIEQSRSVPASAPAVGTSGFSYSDWKGSFYPEWLPARDYFHYYAARFRAVEINLTFYRPVSAKTLQRWKASAPGGFRFAMKASQAITHTRRLEDCGDELRAMVDEFAPLGEQLGCILFQLPPSLRCDDSRLASFLKLADSALARLPRETRLAMEFRHGSWNVPATQHHLAEHGWGMVVHDMPGAGGWTLRDGQLQADGWTLSPGEFLEHSRRLLYLRFHGTTGKYAGEYGERWLRSWAGLGRAALDRGIPVHAYFNNTQAGGAPRDALTMRRLLEGG